MFQPRNRYFLVLDFVMLVFIPAIALALRVDSNNWQPEYLQALPYFILVALTIKLPVFFGFGLYRRYWRYASVDELFAIAAAVALAGGMVTTVFLGLQFLDVFPGQLPRSVPLIDSLLTVVAVGGVRFSVRVLDRSVGRARGQEAFVRRRPTLIVGAGKAGELIVRELLNSSQLDLKPIGFVDDDLGKQGVTIQGVRVLGCRADIPRLVRRYGVEDVVIAMPTAPGIVIRDIVAHCEKAGVAYRIMPGIFEILSGRVGVSHLRPVEIEDLLRREPIETDFEDVARLLSGVAVLVTGAGGSIGSELSRQIARQGPAVLVLLGHGENSLFTIQNELRAKWPNIRLEVVVADIRDRHRLRAVFERTRPQIVFHAAAHKHVPLMETNCEDAVTNNVGGTQAVVSLAAEFGVERFVLISSDKAVNPTNVMGATKRVAELIVTGVARQTGRAYAAVRFGNVLDSRGSVVPIFREQIARGGPVTITHPDVTRYFMTIPEAVQLVLQACTLSRPGASGETFVLDMGEPVKIVDLARDLIELSGLKVGEDIEIVFTGLRSGEKLHEELFVAGESQQRTRHNKIFVARDPQTPPFTDSEAFQRRLNDLLSAAKAGRADEVHRHLQVIVPEYAASPVAAGGAGSVAVLPPASPPVELSADGRNA